MLFMSGHLVMKAKSGKAKASTRSAGTGKRVATYASGETTGTAERAATIARRTGAGTRTGATAKKSVARLPVLAMIIKFSKVIKSVEII